MDSLPIYHHRTKRDKSGGEAFLFNTEHLPETLHVAALVYCFVHNRFSLMDNSYCYLTFAELNFSFDTDIFTNSNRKQHLQLFANWHPTYLRSRIIVFNDLWHECFRPQEKNRR